MRVAKLLAGTVLGAIVLLSGLDQSVAWPVMTAGATADNMVLDVRAVKGGGARSGTHVNRTNVSHTNINRTNVNVNRRANVNVNVNRNVRVGVRPVRVWAPRPYYGTIVGGVALGTMIAVTAMGTVPVAPAPNMCWFWTDAAQMSGYWDYCQAPY